MKITILDPAMCCSTGVCGVDVDEKLVSTAANVKWLKSLGFDVQRHNISNDSAAFKNYPDAIGKLQKEGTNSLPYILINEEIVMQGRYPLKSEWEFWIQREGERRSKEKSSKNVVDKLDASSSNCCSGPGCC